MGTMALKIWGVFVPFFALVTVSIAASTLLDWLLFVCLGLRNPNERMSNFVLPGVVGLPITLIWLRPRLRIFKPDSRGRSPSPFLLVGTLAIIIFAGDQANSYQLAVTGQLTVLSRIRDLPDRLPTRYYRIPSVLIGRTAELHVETGFTGKGATGYWVEVYITAALYDETSELGKSSGIWVARMYRESESNPRSRSAEAQFRGRVENESVRDFSRLRADRITYFLRVPPGGDLENYQSAVASTRLSSGDETIFLHPSFGPFSERTGNHGWLMFAIWIGGSAAWLILILIMSAGEPELGRLVAGDRIRPLRNG